MNTDHTDELDRRDPTQQAKSDLSKGLMIAEATVIWKPRSSV